MKISTRKLVLCAILSAMGTLTFVLESLFPPLILPGARLGLSNVFILLSTLFLGGRYGFATLIIKMIIGSLFSGNVSMLMYSLSAGIVSLSVQIVILFYVKKTSVISASIAGAVINSTVQNLVFCLVTNTVEYLSFLPYLALISVLSGSIVGLIVYLIILKIPIRKNN